MSYQSYRTLVTELLAKGETTSQDNSKSMVEYTKLNNSRMKRLDKTTKLSDDLVSKLKKIDKNLAKPISLKKLNQPILWKIFIIVLG